MDVRSIEDGGTPVAVIERRAWWAAHAKPKRRALPGVRVLKEPHGPCRLCDRPATRFKADSAYCDLHHRAVADLVNAGVTAAVPALEADPEIAAAATTRGGLRRKLLARNAHLWPDRPLIAAMPAAR